MKPLISLLARPGWLAAMALCAALAACGGDSADNKSPAPPGEPAAVTPQLRCAP